MSTTTNRRDITIIAGDTYTQTVIFDESQAGYSFTASLNNSIPFTCSMASDNVTLTLTLNSIVTASLDLDNTVYKWKLRRSDGAATPSVLTVLHGKATVTSV